MVIIPFIFEAETLLTLWLGNCTATMILFARLYAVYTLFLALHNPITTIIQATGNIRKYSIYVESITVLCLPVNWCLFLWGSPPYFLFFTMIGLCILAHIIRLFMLRSCVPSFTLKTYLVRLVFPGIIILGMTVLMVNGVEFLDINKLTRLILSFLVSVVSTFILLCIFGVSKKERNLMRELVYRKIK